MSVSARGSSLPAFPPPLSGKGQVRTDGFLPVCEREKGPTMAGRPEAKEGKGGKMKGKLC